MARATDLTPRTWLLTALCASALVLGPAVCTAQAEDPSQPAAPVSPAATGGAPGPQQPAVTDAAPAADATTQQVGGASASATQQAPVNIAIPVQVLSPGDTGPITQVNTVSADADATNVTQAPAPASPPADATQAPTPASPPADATAPSPSAGSGQQNATATAQATQTAPTNVYIPVTVLSPGDHGPVTQVNSAGAQATATNVDQAGAAAPQAPPAQIAGAGAAAAQPAPQNFSAPVTVGGVDVGEHPASTPWVWTWVWELDCSSGTASPPVAALAPIISQVTGGAWEWHWTWTCSPAAGDPSSAPGASHPQDSAPGAPPEPGQAGADAGPGAAAPAGASEGPAAQHGAAHARHRSAGAGVTAAPPLAAMSLGAMSDPPPITPDITTSTVISPAATAHSGPAQTRAPAPPPGAPDPRPAPPAPPVLAAGASGGSGGTPLSIGLAALIGAFLLTVPRFGARTRTQLVHRSAQVVPDARDRPG